MNDYWLPVCGLICLWPLFIGFLGFRLGIFTSRNKIVIAPKAYKEPVGVKGLAIPAAPRPVQPLPKVDK